MACPSQGADAKLTIETFKQRIWLLELSISDRFKSWTKEIPPELSNFLCAKCAVVGKKLNELIQQAGEGVSHGNTVSRDCIGNIFLGTIDEILAERGCALCCLMARQFLRNHRRQIFIKAQAKDLQLDDIKLERVLEILSSDQTEESDGDSFIQELFSSNIQLSLDTLVKDGTLSFWWPEDLSDETNDEHSVIPMITEDYQALFGKPSPWVQLPTLEPITAHQNLDLFRKCFDDCMKGLPGHRSCSPRKAFSSHPRRLIHVHELRIMHTKDLGQDPNYFALSYVWGKFPFITLTRDNHGLLSQRNSLELDKLPMTISDAVLATRHFGRDYLWVDSLCIIQDDENDKFHEIDRMHLIYSLADMTIVSATGDHAFARFLEVNLTLRNQEPQIISKQRFTLDSPEMREVTEFTTWFTRGWTLQELLFSKRILYFTPESTYYTCDLLNCSEDRPLIDNVDLEVYKNQLRDDDPKVGFNISSADRPFEAYGSMVEKMSTRTFTQEDDILNACQGLYKGRIAQYLGPSVCGLPECYFESCLAWQPAGNLRRRGGFPSWSWSGWVGTVDYTLLSNPAELNIRCLIEWRLQTPLKDIAYIQPPGNVDDTPRDIISCCSVHPNQMIHGHSTWLQRITGEHSPEICSIIPGALLFHAKAIQCSVREAVAPGLSAKRDLRFFSVMSKDQSIGEIKLDSASFNKYFQEKETELIALYKMDFGTSGAQNVLWMNQYSKVGQFGKGFIELIDGREDKDMYAVMWIRWEWKVAYRVSVGYVTVDGFVGAEPVEKVIVLG
jgi:hypothetical protein